MDKLTEYHQDHKELKYHVACKAAEEGEFEYHNARCFKVKVPNLGSAQAILYDVAALRKVAVISGSIRLSTRSFIFLPAGSGLLQLILSGRFINWAADCI